VDGSTDELVQIKIQNKSRRRKSLTDTDHEKTMNEKHCSVQMKLQPNRLQIINNT